MSYAPHMLPKVRSDQIMAAASGQPCTLRVSSFFPGHRCASPNTTVACHLPVSGKGMSTKVTDMATAFGCQNCHDIVDARDAQRHDFIVDKYPTAYAMRLLCGLVETHALLLGCGAIVIPDAEFV